MSKHNILTEEEMAKYVMCDEIVRYIEYSRTKLNLSKHNMKILEWGCGRGRAVLWLRERGYNAYGVDIDLEPIENGRPLFRKKGIDPNVLFLLKDIDRIPNGFFDFVFSYQVFEHIADIDTVVAYIKRITSLSGFGLHIYPGHKYLIEGHLYMPIVHWIPRNYLRKIMIFIFLLLGMGPKWLGLDKKGILEQTQTYFEYSANKTFYRNCSTVRKIFERNGFNVYFVTINNPKLNNITLLNKLITIKPFRSFLNWVLTNFRQVELLTTNK